MEMIWFYNKTDITKQVLKNFKNFNMKEFSGDWEFINILHLAFYLCEGLDEQE